MCALSYALVAAAWCGSLAMTLLPLIAGTLPGDRAMFYFFELDATDPARFLGLAVGAIGLLFVAPRVTLGAAHVQWLMANRLLGPTDQDRLNAQVAEAQSRRTAAVDSAEAERRRIERDLHDGAQQRLVALAANLGAARDKLDDDPAAGKEMVAAAHEEAKAALSEIRDLVRGIHPVILEDRGIDAALSAVVARSPVPVVLDVQHRRAPAGGGRERRLLRRHRSADERRPPQSARPVPTCRSLAPRTASSSRSATTDTVGPTHRRARASAGCANVSRVWEARRT